MHDSQVAEIQSTTRASNVVVPKKEHIGALFTRMCQGACEQPIPPNRRAAQPNALLCVSCLEAAGDVLPLKRFDETTGDGEQVQTFFTKNRRIERQINHLNKSDVAGVTSFNAVSGVDEHLDPEVNEIIDGGRSLASVFDDPADTPSLVGIKGRAFAATKAAQKLSHTELKKAA